ncbi:hypothetical protein ACIGCZ_34805 [Streptomyces nigra]|uniref:hypothetical protein n=1 Tax=Streptomyces nigra TaxID=1827580 RepID=UPI0037D1FAFA
MFNGKRIVAVSGLLGGLALAGIGAGPAQAAAPACALDAQGDIICTQTVTGQTPEGDDFVLRRSVNCQPSKPLTLPAPGVLSNGQTRIGPQITCADMNEPAPAVPADSGEQNEVSPLIARLLG